MPIHRLLLLLLLGLALLATLPATAQEGIRLLESSVAPAFPNAITFQLRAQGPSNITRAEVRFATEQRACAPVETSGFADFPPSPHLSASWTWDLRKGGSLPPGATVRYRWLLGDRTGPALDTPWQTFQAQDSRRPWRQMSRGPIRLFWYEGDDAFAAALLDSAQESLARLEALAQLQPTGPLSLYIYASGQHLQDALVFPEEWTGGVAFAGFNIIAIGIAPGSLTWGRRAVAHEVTHVLLDQATFTCLGRLPTWLNEGLATYNEDPSGQVQPTYGGPLQEGIRSGRLLSVPGLSNGFPTDAQEALLAYGQSNSLAAYLSLTYGPERLRLLLDAIRRGAEADAALRATYGFDQEGLDALWRAHVGAPPREAGAGGTRLLLPTPVLPAFEPYALDTPTPTPTPFPTAAPAIVATPTLTPTTLPTLTPARATSRGGCNGGLPMPTPTVTPTPILVATPTGTTVPVPTPTPTPTPTPSPTSTPTPFPTPTASAELLAGVPRSQTLVLAEGEPRSLDPALSQDTTSLLYVAHIFSGLVRLDQSLRLAPDLAESWEALDGGTRYRFHLRPNARFHSGRPITAQDIAYSLQRATDPALHSPTAATYLSDILGVNDRLAGAAQTVSGVRVLDNRTLEITIDGPKAYFLAKLAYPVAYVVDHENVADGPEWWRAPNGSGPFRLKAWEAGQHLLLERNPDFYRAQQGVRYVAFRFLTEPPIRLYEEGEIGSVQVGAGSLPRILDPQSRLAGELRTYGELSVFYIGFNTARPPFDDPLVRRAFAMALEVDRLVEADQEGYVQRAVGLLPPGMPGYTPNPLGLPYDPAEARRLLAQSRYGGPAGLPTIVYTSSGLDQIAPFLGAAAEMWRANLGVEISVRLIPTDEYFYRLSAEVDNLFDFGWIADYPDPENLLDVLFHAGAPNNTGAYANPQVDALLEAARIAQAPGQRLGLYRQAQDLLLQDGAAVPLWHGTSYVLVKPYVQGYALTAQGVPTLESVWLNG